MAWAHVTVSRVPLPGYYQPLQENTSLCASSVFALGQPEGIAAFQAVNGCTQRQLNPAHLHHLDEGHTQVDVRSIPEPQRTREQKRHREHAPAGRHLTTCTRQATLAVDMGCKLTEPAKRRQQFLT